MKTSPMSIRRFQRSKSAVVSQSIRNPQSKTAIQQLSDLLLEDDSLLLVVICAFKVGGSADLFTANGILSLYSKKEAALISFLKQLILRRADRFKGKKKDITDMLRDNSIVPILLNAYAREQGLLFVHKILSQPLNKFLASRDEIPPQEDQSYILSLSEDFFNSILSQRDQMPSVIVTMCQYIYKSLNDPVRNEVFMVPKSRSWKLSILALFGKRESTSNPVTSNASVVSNASNAQSGQNETNLHEPVDPEIIAKIVGTFLFLRFLIPAISFPENYGLVGRKLITKERGILIKVGKLLASVTTNASESYPDDSENSATQQLLHNYRQLFKNYIVSTYQTDNTTTVDASSSADQDNNLSSTTHRKTQRTPADSTPPSATEKKQVQPEASTSVSSNSDIAEISQQPEKQDALLNFLRASMENWDMKTVEKTGIYDSRVIELIHSRVKSLKKMLSKMV